MSISDCHVQVGPAKLAAPDPQAVIAAMKAIEALAQAITAWSKPALVIHNPVGINVTGNQL